jgi:CRP-like cAMP-binding protein
MQKLQFNEINSISAKLDTVNIFHYLTDDEKRELLKICEIFRYEQDEKIISQDETGTNFFAVLSGAVNVSIFDSGSGKEVFLSGIGEGEFFGEAGIFRNIKRTANVSAATTAEIICIKRSDFFKFISKFTSAGVKILMFFVDGLLKKLSSSNKELAFERRGVMDQIAIDQFLQTIKNE